jgi:hypothetical protein
VVGVPVAGDVDVDVVVVVDDDVAVDVSVLPVVVDGVVVVELSPPQAAKEATNAKLPAARAMVFKFNVIKLSRLLLA